MINFLLASQNMPFTVALAVMLLIAFLEGASREHYLFLKNCLPRDEVHLVYFENKLAYFFSWPQS